MAVPTGQGLSAAQWEAWFSANASTTKYAGTARAGGTVPLAGKTWAQVYASLYAVGQAQAPKQTPDQIATATLDLAVAQGVGNTFGAAEGAAGAAVAVAGTGVANASFLPSWAAGLASILSDLGNAKLWLRIAEGLLGIVLIAVGTAHMTKVVPAATAIASKVP